MFEKYISNILVSVLSEYAEDVDPAQLELKIFSGTASIANLRLKASAIDALHLPVTLHCAICKKVQITIPIRNLQSKPCIADIEELFVTLQSPMDRPFDVRAFEAAQAAAKLAIIDAFEKERKKRSAAAAAAGSAAEGEGQEGFVSRLVEVIVNNLVINVKSVHIRYESQGSGAVFGALVQQLGLATTDADGSPTFVDPTTTDRVHKRLSFSGLQLYAEPQVPVAGGGCGGSPVTRSGGGGSDPVYFTSISDTAQWSRLMAKRVSSGNVASSTIFGPVDGAVSAAVMFKHKIKANLTTPYAAVQVQIQNFVATLSRPQYVMLVEMAARASNWQLLAPFYRYRPIGVPTSAIVARKGTKWGSNEAARQWWKFALSSIRAIVKKPRLLADKTRISAFFRDVYADMYAKLIISNVVKDNRTLLEGKEKERWAARVVPAAHERRLLGVSRAMTAVDIIECRKKAYTVVASEMEVIRQRLLEAKRDRAAQRASSWFSFGIRKSADEKSEEQMLREIESEWGVVAGQDAHDITAAELPAHYQWVNATVALPVGGLSLQLPTGERVALRLTDIGVTTTVFNAPDKSALAFSVTTGDLALTNPFESTAKAIPHLISRYGTAAAKKEPLLVIRGATNPLESPLPDTPLDLSLAVAVQPLLVVADPVFLSSLGAFFAVPATVDVSGLSNTTQGLVTAVTSQAASAVGAVQSAKSILANVDIRAPVIILPQDTHRITAPCLVASLGRLRLDTQPLSITEKKRRLELANRAPPANPPPTAMDSSTASMDDDGSEQALIWELHYYRNEAVLGDLYVNCCELGRALKDTSDGFAVIPRIQLTADVFMKINADDQSRESLRLRCHSDAMRLCLSTHTAYLLTSMSAAWATKAVRSVRSIQAELDASTSSSPTGPLPAGSTPIAGDSVTSPTLAAAIANEQRLAFQQATELGAHAAAAAASTASVTSRPEALEAHPWITATVRVGVFAFELYDDIGARLLMRQQAAAAPDQFFGDGSRAVPAVVPGKLQVSAHPSFVVRASPLCLRAHLDDQGEVKAEVTLADIAGIRNALADVEALADVAARTLDGSAVVLGGGAQLTVRVFIAGKASVPAGEPAPPMGLRVDLAPELELHLGTPLMLLLEATMDVVNMLTGTIADVEADTTTATAAKTGASQKGPSAATAAREAYDAAAEAASSCEPHTPVMDGPPRHSSAAKRLADEEAALTATDVSKVQLAVRIAGIRLFAYNNYYYTDKGLRDAQDSAAAAQDAAFAAARANSKNALAAAAAARSMSAEGTTTFDHLRIDEDYLYAVATVQRVEVDLDMKAVTMTVSGHVGTLSLQVHDDTLPPMYRTVLAPLDNRWGEGGDVDTNDVDAKSPAAAVLSFAFSKFPREFPVLFDEDTSSGDGSGHGRRTLRDADIFRPSSHVSVVVEPSRVVYDAPTIMSLLEWATSGFLSRLSAVAVRPRYDGKFMVPPPPVPRKVMQLSIEVKGPRAVLPLNPRRGRLPSAAATDDTDAAYVGAHDHIEASLGAVTITSGVSVGEMHEIIRIALTGLTLYDTAATAQEGQVGSGAKARHVDPTATDGPLTCGPREATPLLPHTDIDVYMTNPMDPLSATAKGVLVRIRDEGVALHVTAQALTRVMTLVANNVLNMEPAAPPRHDTAAMVARRTAATPAAVVRRNSAAELHAQQSTVTMSTAPAPPPRPMVVSVNVSAVRLVCATDDHCPQFEVFVDTLGVHLVEGSKTITWAGIDISDTRPISGFSNSSGPFSSSEGNSSISSAAAATAVLFSCGQSSISLRNTAVDCPAGTALSPFSELMHHVTEVHRPKRIENESSSNDIEEAPRGAVTFDEGHMRTWFADLSGAGALSPRGIDEFIIDIDFAIDRFALSEQWLAVFDYLLNERNMAALGPLTGAKPPSSTDAEVGTAAPATPPDTQRDKITRVSLSARSFTVPFLDSSNTELFSAQLNGLSVDVCSRTHATASSTTEAIGVSSIYVSIGSLWLAHTASSTRLLYSQRVTGLVPPQQGSSSASAASAGPLLEISIVSSSGSNDLQVLMQGLNANATMPLLNALIFYASDPSQPISKLAKLGVMREERERLAARALQEASKARTHLRLEWTSPTITVPCDARPAALSGDQPETIPRSLTVDLGRLRTVVELHNQRCDVPLFTCCDHDAALGLTTSAQATGVPAQSGTHATLSVTATIEQLCVEGLLDGASASVSFETSSHGLLPSVSPPAADAAGHALFLPAPLATLDATLASASLRLSPAALNKIMGALYYNLLYKPENLQAPPSQPQSITNRDPSSAAIEASNSAATIASVASDAATSPPPPPLAPLAARSTIRCTATGMTVALTGGDAVLLSTLTIADVTAALGGPTEADADKVAVVVHSISAIEHATNTEMLSTAGTGAAVTVDRARMAVDGQPTVVTTVHVSALRLRVVPHVIGGLVDLALTPLAEQSSATPAPAASGNDNATSVPSDAPAPTVSTRTSLRVVASALTIDLVRADGRPVATLDVASSEATIDGGVPRPLRDVTGQASDAATTVATTVTNVVVGRIAVANRTLGSADGISRRAINPRFEQVLKLREDTAAQDAENTTNDAFVTVHMIALDDGPSSSAAAAPSSSPAPHAPSFRFASNVDVTVTSLQVAIVPALVAELAAAVEEASASVTNAAKARKRAEASATTYMADEGRNLTRLRVLLKNPGFVAAPTPYADRVIEVFPGSLLVTNSLSPGVVPATQILTYAVGIEGMSALIDKVPVLGQRGTLHLQYDALKIPKGGVAPPHQTAAGTTAFTTSLDVNIPHLALDVTDAQLLFLFSSIGEFSEAQRETAERVRKSKQLAPDTAGTAGAASPQRLVDAAPPGSAMALLQAEDGLPTSETAPAEKSAAASSTAASEERQLIRAAIGHLSLGIVDRLDLTLSGLAVDYRTPDGKTSVADIRLESLAGVHQLWPHLPPSTQRTLTDLTETRGANAKALLRPCVHFIRLTGVAVSGTIPRAPAEGDLSELKVNIGDGELALTPDTVACFMAAVYEPLCVHVLRKPLRPVPIITLRHEPVVTLEADVTLSPDQFLLAYGDDLCAFVLDLGGHTLTFTGPDPAPQIVLGENVCVTVRNGSIVIPGAYALSSFVHFSSQSQFEVDTATCDISQKLWRTRHSRKPRSRRAPTATAADVTATYISLLNVDFCLGVQLLTQDQALRRYLEDTIKFDGSACTATNAASDDNDDNDSDAKKKPQPASPTGVPREGSAASAAVAALREVPLTKAVEIGLVANGRALISQHIITTTGKAQKRHISVHLDSLASYDGRLLRPTGIEADVIGVDSVSVIVNVRRVESTVVLRRIQQQVSLIQAVVDALGTAASAPSTAGNATSSEALNDTTSASRTATLESRRVRLGAVEGGGVPKKLRSQGQLRDMRSGLPLVTRVERGTCQNCGEPASASLVVAGTKNKHGDLCLPCATGRTALSLGGGDLRLEKIDVLLVGDSGEMIEVMLDNTIVKQEAEDVNSAEGESQILAKMKMAGTTKENTDSNLTENINETRTTVAVTTSALIWVFNGRFSTWEPLLEHLELRLRGWVEDNIWHVRVPRKTEVTLSLFAVRLLSTLAGQLGAKTEDADATAAANGSTSTSRAPTTATTTGAMLSASSNAVGGSHSSHPQLALPPGTASATTRGKAAVEASERARHAARKVCFVNHHCEGLAVRAIHDPQQTRHVIPAGDRREITLDGSECFIMRNDERMKIFLDQHAFFTIGDVVCEVTVQIVGADSSSSPSDDGGNVMSTQHCTVVFFPVHRSGALVRLVSRIPCALISDAIGVLNAGSELYLPPSVALSNPLILEPFGLSGGQYHTIETVGRAMPPLRSILNGVVMHGQARHREANKAPLCFRLSGEVDGSVCGAPRFTVVVEGGCTLTNNLPLPVSVEIRYPGSDERIEELVLPSLRTRQIIFANRVTDLVFRWRITAAAASEGASPVERQFASPAGQLAKADGRLVLVNAGQKTMHVFTTVSSDRSAAALHVPFAILNHCPVPLELIPTEREPAPAAWQTLPSAMSAPVPATPSAVDRSKPEFSVHVRCGDFSTRDAVPLHVVGSIGEIRLSRPDGAVMELSFLTQFGGAGEMLVVFVPRWTVVNRTPWALTAAQYLTASEAVVDRHALTLEAHSAQNFFRTASAVEPATGGDAKKGRAAAAAIVPYAMVLGIGAIAPTAMAFSIEEMGDALISIPGTDPDADPDRQLRVSVFPDGARTYVIIEVVKCSAFLLVNRTPHAVFLHRPPIIETPKKESVTKDRTRLREAVDLVRSVHPNRGSIRWRELAVASAYEKRAFALNEMSAAPFVPSVAVTVVVTDAKDGSTSFLVPLQNINGSPIHTGTVFTIGPFICCVQQGTLGQVVLEVRPATAPAAPAANAAPVPSFLVLSPPRPHPLDASIAVSYLSFSLVDQPREITFGAFVDVRARIQRTAETETLSMSILNFQFDNQTQEDPPYEGCLFAIRSKDDQAAVQAAVQRRFVPGKSSLCFTEVRLDMCPVALRLSDVLLFRLADFYTRVSAREAVSDVAKTQDAGEPPTPKTASASTMSDVYAFADATSLYAGAPVAAGAMATLISVERMVINPVIVRLWFARQRSDAKRDIIRASQNAMLSLLVVSCEDVMVRVAGLTVQGQTGQAKVMLSKFSSFYWNGLQSQVAAVLFQYVAAFPLIGAPVKLAADIGLGTLHCFQDRIDDMMGSPEAFALGIAKGTAGVVGNVIGGSLNVVGSVVGSTSKLASIASGDRVEHGKRPNTATGLLRGITGLVTKPMHGAAEGGALGFFKGLGHGVVGIAANPVAGILSDVARASNLVGSVFTDRFIPEVHRLRDIRQSQPGGAVAPFGTTLETFEYQRRYASDHVWSRNLLPTDGPNWKPGPPEALQQAYPGVTSASWVLDRSPGASFDGWVYAATMADTFDRPQDEDTHVRRRRWVVVLAEREPSAVIPPIVPVSVMVESLEATTPTPRAALGGEGGGPSTPKTAVAAGSQACTSADAAEADRRAQTVQIVDIYENQRFFPLSGWGKRMLPTDRHRWSDVSGVRMPEPAEMRPPPGGWAWADEWHLVGGAGSGDAWEYALDFGQRYTPKKSLTDCVRRRCWRRTLKKTD